MPVPVLCWVALLALGLPGVFASEAWRIPGATHRYDVSTTIKAAVGRVVLWLQSDDERTRAHSRIRPSNPTII